MPTPIIVMSFNRPQFLEKVLASLKAQIPGSLDGREIHLFQDGAANRYSRLRYARDVDIAASIEVFKSFFPEGIVHAVEDNIGICENFQRAERFIFEDRDFECAYFLEDDLVLSPAYLNMMDALQEWAEGMPNVAYFAAYGNYYADRKEIQDQRRELMTLDHHWGFGLLRRHWRAMQPLLAPFYDVVVGTDYSRRHHQEVFALYEAQDAAPRASSQDAAKAFACARLGVWRCNTVMPFAKYIGDVGQHMTSEVFEALGFSRVIVANEMIRLRYPVEAEVAAAIAEQQRLFEEVHRSELADLIINLPGRKYDPIRTCDRNDVIFGYRLFLNRDPESEAVIAARTDTQTVYKFVRGLVESREFREGDSFPQTRVCTRDDVIYVYRLCLHRDPEPTVVAEHVGNTDARSLALATLGGVEATTLLSKIQSKL